MQLPCLTEEEAAGLGSNNWAVAGTAHRERRRARRQRHAPGDQRAEHLVSRADHCPRHAAAGRDADVERRDAARSRQHGRRQQRPRRVGFHQHRRRLERFDRSSNRIPASRVTTSRPRGPSRSRSSTIRSRRRAVSRPFQSRWTIWGPIVRRDHRGRDLVQRWVAHDARLLASDVTATRERPDRRRSAGRRGRPRHSRAELRRRRYAPAASAGRSPARFRGASASTDRGRRRGPTAPAAGTATSPAPSSRAWPTPPRGGSGPPTRRSSKATRSPASAKAGTPTASARGVIRDRLMAIEKAAPRRHARGAARRQRALPRALAHARSSRR